MSQAHIPAVHIDALITGTKVRDVAAHSRMGDNRFACNDSGTQTSPSPVTTEPRAVCGDGTALQCSDRVESL